MDEHFDLCLHMYVYMILYSRDQIDSKSVCSQGLVNDLVLDVLLEWLFVANI